MSEWPSSIHLTMFGANYRLSSIEELERLTSYITPELLSRLSSKNAHTSYALLSTCNRVEVYALSLGGGDCARLYEVSEIVGMNLDSVLVYQGREAVRHLIRVASGLESLAVGEPQILFQVRNASIIAGDSLSRRAIERLFRHAYNAGRRIRKKLGMTGDSSIGALAAKLIRSVSKPSPRILVIGSGEMARAFISSLNQEERSNIIVATRRPEKAGWLRERGITVIPLEEFKNILPSVDAAITATSSKNYIITKQLLEGLKLPKNLTLVDISVPRNIEPDVASLPNVRLYNINDLREYSQPEAVDCFGLADGLVDAEVERYVCWLSTLEVFETIRCVRMRAEEIRAEELAECLKRLNGQREHDEQVLATMTRRIINRLLHEPTIRLKERARNGDVEIYKRVLTELFG
ncbi:MAG: glutamyl-tRNA reductase [Aigarchaeota archaeon]|nr:glutamyl-tRNA reductase [Candidatus Pelearchaeum maunauluense]